MYLCILEEGQYVWFSYVSKKHCLHSLELCQGSWTRIRTPYRGAPVGNFSIRVRSLNHAEQHCLSRVHTTRERGEATLFAQHFCHSIHQRQLEKQYTDDTHHLLVFLMRTMHSLRGLLRPCFDLKRPVVCFDTGHTCVPSAASEATRTSSTQTAETPKLRRCTTTES